MKYFFHELAEKEFFTAIEYYESCEKNLGIKFSNAVLISIANILENPCTWRRINDSTRQLNINNFPYAILYQIMAVMNLHRKPNYWKNRKQKNGE